MAVGEPALVYAVAAVLSRWRLNPYRPCWTYVIAPVVGPPEDPEPAAPHRFAKLLGATGAARLTTVGFAVAATTGFYLGCRMYRQVSFLRSRDVL